MINEKIDINSICSDAKKSANPIESQNIDFGINVVFFGRPGSGKSTAIDTAGNGLIFADDECYAKSSELIKDEIAFGIDYSEFQLRNHVKLKLFGTPSQKHNNVMHDKAIVSADIYITLIDLTSVAPIAEFMHFSNIIETQGNRDALKIVAFTHYDEKEHNMMQLSKEIRRKCNGEILTVKIDARQSDEVRFMLRKAVDLIMSNKPKYQLYADNNMFLRNINA